MHPADIVAVAGAFGAALSPIGAFAFALVRRRSRRREADGRCASCGAAWTSLGPAPTEFVVQGDRVCGSCAHRIRTRTAAALGVLAVAVVVTAAVAVPEIASWSGGEYHHLWWDYAFVALPPVALAATAVGAVRRMRAANRTRLRDAARPVLLGAP